MALSGIHRRLSAGDTRNCGVGFFRDLAYARPRPWLSVELAKIQIRTGDHLTVRIRLDLIVPIGIYEASTRAAKYAVLFIGLSFLIYFLFEIFAQLRLHPLQYLLLGLANCMFYLLLLAISEHLPFGFAYFVSGARVSSTGEGTTSTVAAGALGNSSSSLTSEIPGTSVFRADRPSVVGSLNQKYLAANPKFASTSRRKRFRISC